MRVVEVTAGGGACQVVVDGMPRSIDAAQVGDRWSLIAGPAEGGHDHSEVDGRSSALEWPYTVARFSRPGLSYEVALIEQSRGEFIVHVNGIPMRATLAPGPMHTRGRRVPAGRSQERGGRGVERVVAPMPGRVVKVLVERGDTVVAHQGVVVIEAMKMENELQCSAGGVVSELRVAEGGLVEANAVLLVITPKPDA
jgi:biotin carboxyl carrier protein